MYLNDENEKEEEQKTREFNAKRKKQVEVFQEILRNLFYALVSLFTYDFSHPVESHQLLLLLFLGAAAVDMLQQENKKKHVLTCYFQ